jgi:phosphatidylserine/phosphatidylglycerophosphate/cardiolipin synthase-like enzyme
LSEPLIWEVAKIYRGHLPNDFLANQGVPTTIDAAHAIAHNKIIIIDIIYEEMVITGSFNFTKAAQEENAENLLIIRDPALAAPYTQNWQVHAQHSEPYVGRGGAAGMAAWAACRSIIPV